MSPQPEGLQLSTTAYPTIHSRTDPAVLLATAGKVVANFARQHPGELALVDMRVSGHVL